MNGFSTYYYKCKNCLSDFEYEERIKDKRKIQCSICNTNSLETQILSAPISFVQHDAKTLGQQAERNTKKMGRYELEEKRHKDSISTRMKKLQKKIEGKGTVIDTKKKNKPNWIDNA